MLKSAMAVLALVAVSSAAYAEKPVIASETDLPDVRFPVAAAPSDLLETPRLAAMFPALQAEAERLLRDYDIRDPAIAGSLRQGLAAMAVLQGRQADADRLIADYRAIQTKPQLRRLGGVFTDLAAAQIGRPAGARCAAASARLKALVDGADPQTDRDQIISTLGRFQVASLPYFAGTAAGLVDPEARRRGSVGVLDGLWLASFEVGATTLPPCREALSGVARAWLAAPGHAPVDIWPARQPDAALLARARPVAIAVWDSGFDVSLFPNQLAQDPAEPIDGKDNDGDGVIDDTNGPTFDVKLMPRAASLMPPSTFLRPRLAGQQMIDKGQLDLRFGLDTVEARMFAERARSASTAEQGEDALGSVENGGRAHGTACASEIADGAPFVRLFNVAALPWGATVGPDQDPYDEAVIARWAAVIDRVGARMRGAGVRAVNMSWNLTADEISRQLLQFGLEKDAARAKARGIAMQKTIADALLRMMTASPDILFVVAAGNSNQPDDILASTPNGFRLANLLQVGATGVNGRPTSFTTFGKAIDIYAQGEAVPLRWPGDIAVHESGTSMATPLVVRAAATMFALDPRLTAAEAKAALLDTATAGEGGLKLLHPGAAARWAAFR